MTIAGALSAFVGAASLLTITPGLDTALVLRSAAGGPRPAAYAALGIAIGCLIWGAAVSIGLGALLAASRFIYTAVRLAGAVYLVWIGIQLVTRPRGSFDARSDHSDDLRPVAALRQGVLTNVLNPKVGIFYVTFLPQFVPPGARVGSFLFLLAVIHVLIGLVWFAVLISATVPMGRLLKRPRFVRAMDRIVGAVFIGFGSKLALS